MTAYVIDASAAVEYLVKSSLGTHVADLVEDDPLVAPELIDAEILSVLRSWVLRGHIEESRAVMIVEDVPYWPVHRIPNRELARLAWDYHRNVSAYDALYVAAARAHDLPLLTADMRLARAPDLGIVVQAVQAR